jgi:SAM-dependent methyltransferase
MASPARACPFCGGRSEHALTASDRNRESTDARFEYERCTACATLFIRDVPEDLSPYYAGDYHRFGDDGAAEWESNATLRAVETARVAMLAEHLAPGGPLVDVGAGPGGFAAAARDAGYDVTAIEMDERSCEYMRERLHVRAIRSDDPITALRELEPARLISMWHVLEHLRDPAAGLAAAYRLLRPGGTLALVTPTADSLGPDWFGDAWWLLEDPTHLRFFSPDSARLALVRAGFTGVRVRRLLLDTLSMEVASLRRAASRRPRPRGVLAERSTVLAALAAAPVTVAARAAVPRLRPSLELVAHRPG